MKGKVERGGEGVTEREGGWGVRVRGGEREWWEIVRGREWSREGCGRVTAHRLKIETNCIKLGDTPNTPLLLVPRRVQDVGRDERPARSKTCRQTGGCPAPSAATNWGSR